MAKRSTASTAKAKVSTIVVSGRGLSFSVLDIDRETFVRFTKTGIPDDEFEDLKYQLTEAGDCITAPFLEHTTVSIDGKKYRGTWKNIQSQFNKGLPPATKVFKVPRGSYSVIMEVSLQGEFVKDTISGFVPEKLSFDLEHIQLANDREYVLLDPYYDNNYLEFGKTKATGSIYVVDGAGNRFDIKRVGD